MHSHFGIGWGPFSTVAGGIFAIVTGGPVGWVVGAVTIIGGFSWAASDIQNELNYHRQKGAGATPHAPSGGGENPPLGTPDAPDGGASGAEYKPDHPDRPDAGSDGGGSSVEYIEYDYDWQPNYSGGQVAPDQDLGVGPNNIPPGVVRLGRGGPSSLPTPEGDGPFGPHALPTPDDGGSQGPLSKRPWVSMPLYMPNPEGGGPEGPLASPIIGFISFYKG